MKIIPLQPDGKTPLHEGWTLDGTRREAVFGRGEDAAFRLDDGSLSPRHAAFSWQGGTLVFRDLDSINGIFRNGRKVRRGEIPGEEILVAGNVPLKILPDGKDAAARFRAKLMQVAVVLAAVAVVTVAGKIVAECAGDRGRGAEAAEEEAIEPIDPTPPSPEQQEQFKRLEKSTKLIEEARDALGNDEPPETVAAILVQAVRMGDDLSDRAESALVGLQARYAAPHLEAAEKAAAARDYGSVEREIAAAGVYYAQLPPEVERIRARVEGEKAVEKAVRLMKEGNIAGAAEAVAGIDAGLVPEAEDLRRQIDLARQAEAWTEEFARVVETGGLDAAEKMLEEEKKWTEWLTPPGRKAFGETKAQLRKLEKLLGMYEKDNVHDLLVLDPDDHGVPALRDAAEAMGERCRPRAEADRALLAEAEKTAGPLDRPPADEVEARGSLVAEMPAARLYWGGGRTEEAKERFFAHHGRWVEYVRQVIDRVDAYLGMGAREEARETLRAILPDLMPDSPGVERILSMAEELGLDRP